MKFRRKIPTLNLNPVALTDILFRKDSRKQLFLDLPEDKRVDLLRSVTVAVKKDILQHIPEADIVSTS